ncbi:hypothetical protein LCI18_002941 [Fusarium solani-melongenae]|uniref:Uncharacterized protein n=1 Tax=Fusarium solani subsp. cucurbitae TaxID=2747967 RepID=A0ACD3YSS6_FUSSC|nr:hypothetical protein LCI18_002941 [Fusarium solani-melongenae]
MTEPETAKKSPTKKKLIFNAFVEACSGHQSHGLWQHPDDCLAEFNTLQHCVKFAEPLEKAGFHEIFVADVLGAYDAYKGPKNVGSAASLGAQFPVNDPFGPVSAMAAATENIGFGLTISTTFEEPFYLARRLSTLDHLAGGRIDWNVVTGYLESPAQIYMPRPMNRWMWPKTAGICARARELGHDPQAIKFLVMVAPVLGATEEEAQAKYNEYMSYGSKEDALALFGAYIGIDLSQFGDDQELQYVASNAIRTSVETWAYAIADEMKIGSLGATIVGIPEHAADELERWICEADVDGFNFSYALMPRTFEEIIEFLLPVLRNRRLFWGLSSSRVTYRETSG